MRVNHALAGVLACLAGGMVLCGLIFRASPQASAALRPTATREHAPNNEVQPDPARPMDPAPAAAFELSRSHRVKAQASPPTGVVELSLIGFDGQPWEVAGVLGREDGPPIEDATLCSAYSNGRGVFQFQPAVGTDPFNLKVFLGPTLSLSLVRPEFPGQILRPTFAVPANWGLLQGQIFDGQGQPLAHDLVLDLYEDSHRMTTRQFLSDSDGAWAIVVNIEQLSRANRVSIRSITGPATNPESSQSRDPLAAMRVIQLPYSASQMDLGDVILNAPPLLVAGQIIDRPEYLSKARLSVQSGRNGQWDTVRGLDISIGSTGGFAIRGLSDPSLAHRISYSQRTTPDIDRQPFELGESGLVLSGNTSTTVLVTIQMGKAVDPEPLDLILCTEQAPEGQMSASLLQSDLPSASWVYQFASVPQGRYVVALRAHGVVELARSEPFDARPQQAVALQFELPALASAVEMKLRDAQGQVIRKGIHVAGLDGKAFRPSIQGEAVLVWTTEPRLRIAVNNTRPFWASVVNGSIDHQLEPAPRRTLSIEALRNQDPMQRWFLSYRALDPVLDPGVSGLIPITTDGRLSLPQLALGPLGISLRLRSNGSVQTLPCSPNRIEPGSGTSIDPMALAVSARAVQAASQAEHPR